MLWCLQMYCIVLASLIRQASVIWPLRYQKMTITDQPWRLCKSCKLCTSSLVHTKILFFPSPSCSLLYRPDYLVTSNQLQNKQRTFCLHLYTRMTSVHEWSCDMPFWLSSVDVDLFWNAVKTPVWTRIVFILKHCVKIKTHLYGHSLSRARTEMLWVMKNMVRSQTGCRNRMTSQAVENWNLSICNNTTALSLLLLHSQRSMNTLSVSLNGRGNRPPKSTVHDS